MFTADKGVHFEFKFTHIDSKDPQRVFAVALRVSADKSVSGEWCLLIVLGHGVAWIINRVFLQTLVPETIYFLGCHRDNEIQLCVLRHPVVIGSRL
jgi:Chromosome segregation protein Spc25